MAFRENTNDPNFPNFYNLTQAVGEDCPNLAEDVFLVQYFLQCIYKNKHMSPPAAKLVVDGVCGLVTKSWIHKFQWDMWYDEKEIYPDGIVRPLASNDVYSFGLNANPTILFLNTAMMNANFETYLSLSNHASVPRALRKAMAQIGLPASIRNLMFLSNSSHNYFSGNSFVLKDFCVV
jgi:hypothetical protein